MQIRKIIYITHIYVHALYVKYIRTHPNTCTHNTFTGTPRDVHTYVAPCRALLAATPSRPRYCSAPVVLRRLAQSVAGFVKPPKPPAKWPGRWGSQLPEGRSQLPEGRSRSYEAPGHRKRRQRPRPGHLARQRGCNSRLSLCCGPRTSFHHQACLQRLPGSCGVLTPRRCLRGLERWRWHAILRCRAGRHWAPLPSDCCFGCAAHGNSSYRSFMSWRPWQLR